MRPHTKACLPKGYCAVSVAAIVAAFSTACGSSRDDTTRVSREDFPGDGGAVGEGADDTRTEDGPSNGNAGDAGPSPAGSMDAGASTDDESPPLDCTSSSGGALATKRVVRLTTRQVIVAVGDLVAGDLAAQLTSVHLGSTPRATFPLMAPDEGPTFTEITWGRADEIAEAAAIYVRDNAQAVTGCVSPVSLECVTSYLLTLGTQAYRRALSEDEQSSLTTLVAELTASGASPSEVARWGVHALLSAPQFLYRGELGSDSAKDEPLTPQEMADALSFFLTDGPPDEELRAAVAAGEFVDRAQWRTHVLRLMNTERGRQNLTQALLAYFRFPRLAEPPQGTVDADLRASIHLEVSQLVNRSVVSGTVDELLTSKYSYLDERLARFYGAELDPAAPQTPDGFTWSALPPERVGLLTTAAFLSTHPNGEQHSVVQRGLLIRSMVQCAPPIAFAALADTPQQGATERARAEWRMQEAECSGCHQLIDPYGLVLDTFDGLGRLRATDVDGSPARSDALLADGTSIETVEQLASMLTQQDAFATCLAQHWLTYGLTEPSERPVDACTVAEIIDEFRETERGMPDLVHAVISSDAFRLRLGAN